MTLTPEDLFAEFDRLGLAHETVTHPPVFTVEEARRLRGELPGGHTKNLFVKDKKGAIFLVVARESARIDLKRLHEAIGAAGRISFGSPELLRECLGVEPGSVTSLAAINDRAGRVRVVIDRGLLDHAVICAHPLRNTMTTALRREDLLAFLRAVGHDPVIVTLPSPSPQA